MIEHNLGLLLLFTKAILRKSLTTFFKCSRFQTITRTIRLSLFYLYLKEYHKNGDLQHAINMVGKRITNRQEFKSGIEGEIFITIIFPYMERYYWKTKCLYLYLRKAWTISKESEIINIV